MPRRTPSSSIPGTVRSRLRIAPTPRKIAEKPRAFRSRSVKSRPRRAFVWSSTPSERIALISSWMSARGRRYSGTPSRSMPPATGADSKIVTG